MTDPLRRLSTTSRLWLAVLLCIVPLGLVWQTDVTPGTTLYGDCGYSDGSLCVPDAYLPGSVSSTTIAQSPLRVFLLTGIVLLALCACTPRTEATRRLARIAVVAIGLGAVLAASHGSSRALVSMLAALALAGPPAWQRPDRALLAKQPPAR